ncbi:MAG: alpha/beta hydrolase [Xenophilus sp.]
MSSALPTVLLLPGWQNSGPGHWQSRWQALHGDSRVEQHDWLRPLRGDWSARLEEAVIAASGPVLLAAHSLGCILVAAWAAHSKNTARVQGALLVAPGDVEREDLRQQIPGWAPIVRWQLPFAAVLVGSTDDPYCSAGRARGLAADWGARFVDAGARGHLNAESGLGDWGEGRALLSELNRKIC